MTTLVTNQRLTYARLHQAKSGVSLSRGSFVTQTFQKPQETQDSCSNDSFWNSTSWNFCKVDWIWSLSLQTDCLELPIRRGLAWPGKDVIFIGADFLILRQFLKVFKFLNPKDPPDDEDRWGTAGKAWWIEINISSYYYSVIKQLWYHNDQTIISVEYNLLYLR